MMFQKTSHNFGTIKVGQEVIAEFPYNESVQYILQVSGCPCANVRNMAKQRVIRIEYTPDIIPLHLKAQGFYVKKQNYHVKAQLIDGTQAETHISFEAKIIK